jgi:hypothetical protein
MRDETDGPVLALSQRLHRIAKGKRDLLKLRIDLGLPKQ